MPKIFIKILIIIIFWLKFISVKSQEGYSVYNSYLFDNYYSIHPSIGGLSSCSKLRFLSKQQWTGSSEDTPVVYSLSYHGKIRPKVGLGALLFQDKNGPTHQTGLHLSYVYHVILGRGNYASKNQSLMSFALTYQGFIKDIKIDKFQGGDASDPVLISNTKRVYSNVSFSCTYIFNEIFASFTANSLLPYKDKFENDLGNLTNFKNYYLTAGFITPLSSKYSIEPSVTFFYYEEIPKKHVDINMKFYYENQNFEPSVTLGYRALLDDGFENNLLSIILGAKYKKWIFGYSFDLEIGNIRKYYAPSHKFMLGINLFCGYFDEFNKCKYTY